MHKRYQKRRRWDVIITSEFALSPSELQHSAQAHPIEENEENKTIREKSKAIEANN